MRQLKATQNTPQYGLLSLYLRFIGKFIFMKGQHGSSQYVQNIIKNMEQRGAIITKGNGGWIRIDIVRDHESVKLGDAEIIQEEMDDGQIEDILFDFFSKKYKESKFIVQEVEQ